MVKKLRFTIDSEGLISVQVEGAVGAECVDFSRPFEDALGLVHAREFKDEYYQSKVENQNLEQTGHSGE